MKPRLLDLFSGAGGAARGYQEAGFYVVGVDIELQPNYCGDEFWQDDAIFRLRHDLRWRKSRDFRTFDAIHASPPCQHYSTATAWRGNREDHPDLVAPTRELLQATGLPYVIENVDKAPLRACYMLCGTMFGLPFRRHRYFETNWSPLVLTQPCQHSPEDYSFDHGGKQPESVYRDAMGCEWMTVQESRQAIPPAYTRFVGEHLRSHIEAQAREAA